MRYGQTLSMAAPPACVTRMIVSTVYLVFVLKYSIGTIVQLSPATEYIYQYDGFTDIKDAAVITVSAKVGYIMIIAHNNYAV